MPTWWIRNSQIKHFKSGLDLGLSIASLKCYLLLTVEIDFYSQEKKITINSIANKTSLSRPMVIKAINELVHMNMISKETDYTSTYKILNGVVKGEISTHWVKVPKIHTERALKNIVLHRSPIMLAALKVYCYLLSLRSNALYVKAKHKTIRDNTGIQTNQIKPALDILINHQLIFISNNPGSSTIFKTNLEHDIDHSNYYGFKDAKL